MEKAVKKRHSAGQVDGEPGSIRDFFRRRGGDIFLAILVIYVILLGIGVLAEVFNIRSVLHWWIWRAPGS